MRMTQSIQILVGSACILLVEAFAPVHASAVDQLADLTGKAAAFAPWSAVGLAPPPGAIVRSLWRDVWS